MYFLLEVATIKNKLMVDQCLVDTPEMVLFYINTWLPSLYHSHRIDEYDLAHINLNVTYFKELGARGVPLFVISDNNGVLEQVYYADYVGQEPPMIIDIPNVVRLQNKN